MSAMSVTSISTHERPRSQPHRLASPVASLHCRLLAHPGCVAGSLRAQGSRLVQLRFRHGEQQLLQSALVLLNDFSNFLHVHW